MQTLWQYLRYAERMLAEIDPLYPKRLGPKIFFRKCDGVFLNFSR